MSGLIFAAIQIIKLLLNAVKLLIFLSVIVSWVNADPRNPLVNTVRGLTEPLYRPVRRYLTGKIPLPLDLSPIVVIIIIEFILQFFNYYRV